MLFGEPIYRERNNTIQAILPYRPEDKKTGDKSQNKALQT